MRGDVCVLFLSPALDGPRTVVLTSPSRKVAPQNHGPEAHGMSEGKAPASEVGSREMIEWRPGT